MRIVICCLALVLSGCSVSAGELEASRNNCVRSGGVFSLSHDVDFRIKETYCTIDGFRYKFIYSGNGKGFYADPRVVIGEE